MLVSMDIQQVDVYHFEVVYDMYIQDSDDAGEIWSSLGSVGGL